jgi:hypothetical protein
MSEWIKCLKCGRLWDSYLPCFDNICFRCNSTEEIKEFHIKFFYANNIEKPRGYDCNDNIVN